MRHHSRVIKHKESSLSAAQSSPGSPLLPDLLLRKPSEEMQGFIYLSGEELKGMIKKDKKKKKRVILNKDTRDVSHLKDNIKKKKSNTPFLLPTNINHVKALAESQSYAGLFVNKNSYPMVCTHRECIDRLLSSSSKFRTEDTSKCFISTSLSPENTVSSFQREYLGSPSGIQDMERLNEWYLRMKNCCEDDEESEIVYNLCAKEILRQVTVHCSLRGKVLKQILHRQQNVYNRKYAKLAEDLNKSKESHDKHVKALDLIHKNCLKYKDSAIFELQNSLKRSDELRKVLEESLINQKLKFAEFQQRANDSEQMWKKKALGYLQEMNRVKGVLYVGTERLAEFFSRPEKTEGPISTEDIEKMFKIEAEMPILREMPNDEIKVMDMFKEFNVRETATQTEDLVEVNLKEVQSPMFLKKDKSVCSSQARTNAMDPGEGDQKSPSIEWGMSGSSLYSNQSYESYALITREEFKTHHREEAQSAKLILPPYDQEQDELIKISEGPEFLEAENLQNKGEDAYKFLEEVEHELMSLENPKGHNHLGGLINEAPSHEEESRELSDINENSAEKVEHNFILQLDSLKFEDASMQTESFVGQAQAKSYAWEQILENASTNEESKEALKTLQALMENNIEIAGKRRLSSRARTISIDTKCLSNREGKNSNHTPSSSASSQEILQYLMSLITSATDLISTCEDKKKEIAKLDDQLESKTKLLKIISSPNNISINRSDTMNMSPSISVDDAAVSYKQLLRKTTSVTNGPPNSSWIEGYEIGFDEGKTQGMLNVMEQLKNSRPTSKEVPDKHHREIIQKRKTRRINTRVLEFNFHVAQKVIEKKKTNPGPVLMEKFLTLPISKIKLKSTVSRKNVNKILACIYFIAWEKLSSENNGNIFEATYDEFTNRYSLKTACDKKYVEFIASVIANSEYKRCCMYLKLIGKGQFANVKNYTKYAVNLYLACFNYLMTSKIGLYSINDDEDKMLIPTLRAVECIKEKFDSSAEKTLSTEILSKFDQKSQSDPKKIYPGVIELELALEIILDTYDLYISSIYSGVYLCLKSFGYTEPTYLLAVDADIIMRAFNKNSKDFTEDIHIEDFLIQCFKSNIGNEEEVEKKYLLDDNDDVDEFYRNGIEKLKQFIEKSKNERLNKKTHSVEIWEERVKILENFFADECEIALLGITLYNSELDRMNN